jgi:hypothetical protein
MMMMRGVIWMLVIMTRLMVIQYALPSIWMMGVGEDEV